MAPHQQRVVDEKAQLDDRLHKLLAFIGTGIFDSLDHTEQERLHRQKNAMGVYSAILGERIAAF